MSDAVREGFLRGPPPTSRAWRVILKPTYKGEPPGDLLIFADKLEAMPQLGLVFKRGDDHVVEVIPFGAFSRAAAVDVHTTEALHKVRNVHGVRPDDDD